jgi:predicted RNA-binding protein with EMAP domain
MDNISASDRYVANYLAKRYDFGIKFQGIKRPLNVELKNTITTLQGLKDRIKFLYAFKYAKELRINKIAFYESYVDITEDNVGGFDDATKKYHWVILENDDDVRYMFNTIEGDPSSYRLKASLE